MFIDDALNLVYAYIKKSGATRDLKLLRAELGKIAGRQDVVFAPAGDVPLSYAAVQRMLSKWNEKESIRKTKGVYYTPGDVVQFILSGSIKALYGKLSPANIGKQGLSEIPYRSFCTKKTVFDPTCGAGEYLLACLEIKFDLLDMHFKKPSAQMIAQTVATICGNDINEESVVITKLRILLCGVARYGIRRCAGFADVMQNNFHCYDYVTQAAGRPERYSMIVGNPPYVEDFKSGLSPDVAYGNIYANVLIHAARQLEQNGSIGFVVPLSYISTPRMGALRAALFDLVSQQYILSYADRPDCLFESVHQKLCILIGKGLRAAKRVYTGNYRYWYKEERGRLFQDTQVVRNRFYSQNCIPKLGTALDVEIFCKITDASKMKSVYLQSRAGDEAVYLNRRESFWMKAFRVRIDHPEYKVFRFPTAAEADYCYCLIQSSLFWWYWVATSDCWHVSRELNGFMAPFAGDYGRASALADALRNRLEETKVYVGTKQTDYEYKHKECLAQIRAIDDYVNEIFGLTESQSQYIKSFAFRYRTSGGAKADEGD